MAYDVRSDFFNLHILCSTDEVTAMLLINRKESKKQYRPGSTLLVIP